jgi:hypothetical protein
MPLPGIDPITDSGGTYTKAFEILNSKYITAGNWATWAAGLLEADIAKITEGLENAEISTSIATLLSLLDTVISYTPGTVESYVAPAAPSYTALPSYSAPTRDSLMAIPSVGSVTLPAEPTATMVFTNSSFSDTLLTELKNKILDSLDTSSTGLGSAEEALFTRATERLAEERALAYTEQTSQFTARKFPMPPGAFDAKVTAITAEGSRRLADVNAEIMSESAKLALDYNKHVQTTGLQLVAAIGEFFNSKVQRDFEAAKTNVTLALDTYKALLDGEVAKIDLSKTTIDAAVAYNDGIVKVYLGDIQGQTTPMTAIAQSNAAVAQAYMASVQGAAESVKASVIPEDLALRVMDAQTRVLATKGDITSKAAGLTIEDAAKRLTLEVETLRGLAQASAQIIASSLNGVNVNSSFSWSGSSSYNDTTSNNTNINIDQ